MYYLIKIFFIILGVIVIIYKDSCTFWDTAKDNDVLFSVPLELKWKKQKFLNIMSATNVALNKKS